MNNVLKCIVIDDEPLAIDLIGDFCSKIYYLDLLGKFTDPFQAYKVLNENKVDLVFIDIRMPQISGIDFIKSLYNPPMIIFITAYKEYALEGFEYNAVDYLVKPFAFDRFSKAVNKAFHLHRLSFPVKDISADKTGICNEFLMVKVEYSTIRIDLGDILYIEGLKDYVKIHAKGKLLLTKTTMKNIIERLPPERFFRVHKSYIVAFDKIDMIENSRIVIGNQRIPIGESFRNLFFSMVNKNLV
jgi:DNA-binding LytR/AlgR family response regulator